LALAASDHGEAPMTTDQTRRDVLIDAAIAITGTILPTAWPGSASAQAYSIAASEWDYHTAKELVEALQARRISASELVEHTIARIDVLDRQLNAVVVRDFERAREVAKTADAALARGERRSLLGVPITIKESFNIAGLTTTWGIPEFKDFVPSEDAVLVSRVKSAGAVILGKTNVPIRLLDWQSYNDIYGMTNNPWDLGRTPGGSSGGSAAALAAGFGPLSFGSDIGGSLRVPAHFCGIYAHKPTLGLVPDRGSSPPPFPALQKDSDLSVVGPMARSAADLALALDVVAGPDEDREGVGYRLALRPARHDDLKSFHVLVIDTHPLMPTATAVRTALDGLSQRLARAGAKVAHSSPLLPNLADSARLYMRLLYSGQGANSPPALYDEMRGSAEVLAPGDMSLAAERTRGAVMNHREWVAARTARARLQQQWSMLFREWDVVLCPVAPVLAIPHDHSSPQEARRIEIDGKAYPYLDAFFVWPGLATAPGLPATAAPIARSQTGLPIGAQIVGPYLEDRTTIAFAELVERELGGFVPPPGYAG
jgi:amidase